MAAQYINYIKAKVHILKAPKAQAQIQAHEPILTSDDEAFLQRVTSHPEEAGRDPQIALLDGAQDISLPQSPLEDNTARGSPGADDEGVQRSLSRTSKGKQKEEKTGSPKGKKNGPWGWIVHGMDKRNKVRIFEPFFYTMFSLLSTDFGTAG